MESLNLEQFQRAALSPDLALSAYHLLPSMGHAIAEQHVDFDKNVKKWLDDWFGAKYEQFFWRGIHKLPERRKKCVAGDGHYFED